MPLSEQRKNLHQKIQHIKSKLILLKRRKNLYLSSYFLNKEGKKWLLDSFSNEKSITIFDLEMTGLNCFSDQMIEIAAIKIERNLKVSVFHRLIKLESKFLSQTSKTNPLDDLKHSLKESEKFHGLREKDLLNQSSRKSAIQDFINFIGKGALIAHGAAFDISFLAKATFEEKVTITHPISVYDSLKILRPILKDHCEKFSLESLAHFFQIRLNAHQASEDTLALARILCSLNKYLDNSQFIHTKKAFLCHMTDYKKELSEVSLEDKYHGTYMNIQEALTQKQMVEFEYNGGRNPGASRKLKPLALTYLPKGHFLYGICQNDQKTKYFQISKIKNLKRL